MMEHGWMPMLLVVCATCVGGCAGGPDKQLSSCQQDKDQLLATIREQRDANRQMTEQVASLEKRLDESEKAIARLPANTRISTRPVEKAQLPWRSPGDKGESEKSDAKSSSAKAGGTKTSKSSSARKLDGISLASLAERDERLEYDRRTGAARLALDLPFVDGSANLTGEGRKQLDQVAKLLKSDDAADSRIMVSAFSEGSAGAKGGETDKQFDSPRELATARAAAVAAYLDSHGIAEERLSVSGTGKRSSGRASGDQLASGVEIHLLPPDAPVVGWATKDEVRR